MSRILNRTSELGLKGLVFRTLFQNHCCPLEPEGDGLLHSQFFIGDMDLEFLTVYSRGLVCRILCSRFTVPLHLGRTHLFDLNRVIYIELYTCRLKLRIVSCMGEGKCNRLVRFFRGVSNLESVGLLVSLFLKRSVTLPSVSNSKIVSCLERFQVSLTFKQ